MTLLRIEDIRNTNRKLEPYTMELPCDIVILNSIRVTCVGYKPENEDYPAIARVPVLVQYGEYSKEYDAYYASYYAETLFMWGESRAENAARYLAPKSQISIVGKRTKNGIVTLPNMLVLERSGRPEIAKEYHKQQFTPGMAKFGFAEVLPA